MCGRGYVSVLTVFSEMIREAANSMPEGRGLFPRNVLVDNKKKTQQD